MSNLVIDVQNKIADAESCGLTYCGIDDEMRPEFIGTDKQFKKFEEINV